ncbi:MAG: folate-binding protein [Pseudomonadales bacterium]|nr:folate-binding protein [Pseudomonadales bacterium]
MNPKWQQFLQQQGAVFEEQQDEQCNDIEISQFSTPSADAPTSNQLTAITNTGVIAVNGPDAKKFLQGQLTCNLDDIDQQQSSIGALCTYQGKTICSFRILLDQGTYYLLLHASLTEPVMAYLKKYIAFSKAKMTDASDQLVLIGCWGEQIDPLLEAQLDLQPLSQNEIRSAALGLVIPVDKNPLRFICMGNIENSQKLWNKLAINCEKVPSPNWQLMNIRSGMPEISISTTEQFIPQMLNLDLIGGISFKKGCYTGQEIVARSHYLGKQKRRLLRLQTLASITPAPGMEIFVDGKPQSVGTVINTAPSADENSYEILAVMKIEARDNTLFLGDKNGAKLSVIPLPYAIPFE